MKNFNEEDEKSRPTEIAGALNEMQHIQHMLLRRASMFKKKPVNQFSRTSQMNMPLSQQKCQNQVKVNQQKLATNSESSDQENTNSSQTLKEASKSLKSQYLSKNENKKTSYFKFSKESQNIDDKQEQPQWVNVNYSENITGHNRPIIVKAQQARNPSSLSAISVKSENKSLFSPQIPSSEINHSNSQMLGHSSNSSNSSQKSLQKELKQQSSQFKNQKINLFTGNTSAIQSQLEMPVEVIEKKILKNGKKSQFSFLPDLDQDQEMSDDDSENHKEEEQRQVEIKKRDKSGERFCGNIKDGDDDYDDEVEQQIYLKKETPENNAKSQFSKFQDQELSEDQQSSKSKQANEVQLKNSKKEKEKLSISYNDAGSSSNEIQEEDDEDEEIEDDQLSINTSKEENFDYEDVEEGEPSESRKAGYVDELNNLRDYSRNVQSDLFVQSETEKISQYFTEKQFYPQSQQSKIPLQDFDKGRRGSQADGSIRPKNLFILGQGQQQRQNSVVFPVSGNRPINVIEPKKVKTEGDAFPVQDQPVYQTRQSCFAPSYIAQKRRLARIPIDNTGKHHTMSQKSQNSGQSICNNVSSSESNKNQEGNGAVVSSDQNMDETEKQNNKPISSPNMPTGGKSFSSQIYPKQPKNPEIGIRSKNQNLLNSSKQQLSKKLLSSFGSTQKQSLEYQKQQNKSLNLHAKTLDQKFQQLHKQSVQTVLQTNLANLESSCSQISYENRSSNSSQAGLQYQKVTLFSNIEPVGNLGKTNIQAYKLVQSPPVQNSQTVMIQVPRKDKLSTIISISSEQSQNQLNNQNMKFTQKLDQKIIDDSINTHTDQSLNTINTIQEIGSFNILSFDNMNEGDLKLLKNNNAILYPEYIEQLENDNFNLQFQDVISKKLKKKLKQIPDLQEQQKKYRKQINKRTVVVSLDGCLLKTSVFKDEFPRLDGVFYYKKLKIYVCFRRHFIHFLQNLKNMFEVILWSSSQSDYTQEIVNLVQSNIGFQFDHVLSLDDQVASEENDFYVKNIEILVGNGDRKESDIIILDSQMSNYTNRLTNGIYVPIYNLHEDKQDNVLTILLNYLSSFKDPDTHQDVRKKIKSDFNLMSKFNSQKQIQAFGKILLRTIEETGAENAIEQLGLQQIVQGVDRSLLKKKEEEEDEFQAYSKDEKQDGGNNRTIIQEYAQKQKKLFKSSQFYN